MVILTYTGLRQEKCHQRNIHGDLSRAEIQLGHKSQVGLHECRDSSSNGFLKKACLIISYFTQTLYKVGR